MSHTPWPECPYLRRMRTTRRFLILVAAWGHWGHIDKQAKHSKYVALLTLVSYEDIEMRKIDPDGVLDDFKAQIQEQKEFYEWVQTKRTGNAFRRLAAENYALTLGVMFEGFINDLLVACVNIDASKFADHLKNSMAEKIRDNPKLRVAFDDYCDFSIPAHISKQNLLRLLDPEGRNTSFPNYSSMLDKAKSLLKDIHFDKFNMLEAKRRAVIDLTISLRNNLAHRSRSSFDLLNTTLALPALHPTGLKRGNNRVNDVGKYLQTRVANGNTRISVLSAELVFAAEGLVP
jgi:hypothetical protein